MKRITKQILALQTEVEDMLEDLDLPNTDSNRLKLIVILQLKMFALRCNQLQKLLTPLSTKTKERG